MGRAYVFSVRRRQTLDEIFPRAAAVGIALGATAAAKDGRGAMVGGICQGLMGPRQS